MEGFVNEERFAQSYAGGKFRIKKWGKSKIERELQKRGLSDYCIQKGLEEIPDDEYLATAKSLLEKKSALLEEKDEFIRRSKLTRYLVGKGYEYEIVNLLLK